MQFPGASDRPASDDSEASECARCGIRVTRGAEHCPGCLLRIGLEYVGGEADEEIDDSVEVEAPSDPAPRRRIHGYEVLEEIGRGGMGVIYRARHIASGELVALKCLLDYHIDSRETVARFRREASAAAMLQHPNILPVYEVGDGPDGAPFFAMRLVTGGTLHRYRHSTDEASVRESVRLMAKVAAAVHYAHERGILHRDLKPGNILLDENGEPWVSDFGLAKWLHEPDGLTRTLLVFGTPGYIAPEQAHGPAAALGPAADIYSIGAILFELLTGRPPFLGEHALAVLRKAADEPAPQLRSLAPHLDRQLETICTRCLEREASARYASAAELAADLGRWLRGHRINARPVGQTERAGQWVRRNRAMTAALIVALLCGGFAVARGVRTRALQQAAAESVLNARSIVVLPVLDLDTATEDHKLAVSLASAINESMSAIGPVRVTTTDQRRYAGAATPEKVREVARAANSRTVIALAKRNDATGRRIWWRVLDGTTGKLLAAQSFSVSPDTATPDWSNGYGRELYSLISRADSAPHETLESDPGLRDEAAREWIVAGRRLMFRYTRRELDQAITLFERAIELQPASHTAYAYLASAYVGKGHYNSDPEYVRRGTAMAQKAVELAPTSGDAHRALAGALYEQGELQPALEQLMETAALLGTEDKLEQLIGMTLDVLGRPEDAIPWYRRSLARAGEPAAANVMLGDCWTRLQQDEQAMQAYSRAEQLQPDLSKIRVSMAHLRLMRGELEEARRECRASGVSNDLGDMARMAAQIEFFARDFATAAKLYSDLAQRDTGGGGSFFGATDYQSALGRSLQALGRSVEAEEVLARCLSTQMAKAQKQPHHPEALYRLAAVEATLGLNASAMQHLEDAIEAGWLDARSLKMDPRFDNLRVEARFEKLLAQLDQRVLVKRQALKAPES